MTKQADKDLLNAVLEPEKSGALQLIAAACKAGANPNAVCPDRSTSRGPVQAGSTLLTHAIHENSSNTVEKLLECGADPNLADNNGWTPWMASTLADESKHGKIQEALTKSGSNKCGDHIGHLVRAISNGDIDKARDLIQSDHDFVLLATFRVDLVGHQIRTHNAPMLEFLLQRKMTPSSTNLINAIRARNLPAVDLLLRFGMPPEARGKGETPLVTAAALGEMKIVQRLVEAGADVKRSADKKGEWTASFHARKAGKKAVADWLAERMNEESSQRQDQLTATRDVKYQLLYEQATASERQSTDDIVAVLTRWDNEHGIFVNDATGDTLVVTFSSLPDNLKRLYVEIEQLCPDAFESKRELLKELKKSKRLSLWWD